MWCARKILGQGTERSGERIEKEEKETPKSCIVHSKHPIYRCTTTPPWLFFVQGCPHLAHVKESTAKRPEYYVVHSKQHHHICPTTPLLLFLGACERMHTWKKIEQRGQSHALPPQHTYPTTVLWFFLPKVSSVGMCKRQ